MREPRRNHTAAFKAKVAVAALKDDKNLAELAEKIDLHANRTAQWRAQLIEAATGVFLAPAEKRHHRNLCAPALRFPARFEQVPRNLTNVRFFP